eukprot:gene21737-28132_t
MNITVAKEVPCANINSEKPFDQWFLRSDLLEKKRLGRGAVSKLRGHSVLAKATRPGTEAGRDRDGDRGLQEEEAHSQGPAAMEEAAEVPAGAL